MIVVRIAKAIKVARNDNRKSGKNRESHTKQNRKNSKGCKRRKHDNRNNPKNHRKSQNL